MKRPPKRFKYSKPYSNRCFSPVFDMPLRPGVLAPQNDPPATTPLYHHHPLPPHGTGHVIILKVSLGVCALIKQGNGLCGPGRGK